MMTEADIRRIDASVGRNIRELRARREISQSQLAAEVGVSFQQVQKYETGANRVAAGRLVAIARALGVAPTRLLREAAE